MKKPANAPGAWINVERQLPPLDTKVLAYLDGAHYVCELEAEDGSQVSLLWHDEHYDVIVRHLSPHDHWMYLPEPPQE